MTHRLLGTVEIGNVRTLAKERGKTYVYVGRGRAPDGLEHAHLGNPFVVGAGYAQGEAAAAYLPWLRTEYLRGADVRHTLEDLARRVRAGEHLVLVCWCAPRPCHAEHLRSAVMGLAARD
ncbi:DUF4326 domain-containing protein [Deinococcus enclensis]|uniref:DUF4326 domain-containing protein n=1 Tax=Deinococcus enclensis TaxID=1049582 RepID=A0ABT9MF78_9DEIO|nr:DUF4326 domain-containing protein [Deinococcus enclensis]MDP9765256.1 hypothetical protein [Deinococcus enclensis]